MIKRKTRLKNNALLKRNMFCREVLPGELLPPWIWVSAASRGWSDYFQYVLIALTISLKNTECSCVFLGRVHCMQQLLSCSMASSFCSFCAGMWLRDGTVHLALQESAGGVKHRWEHCWTVQGVKHISFAGIKLSCKTCVCPELTVCISGLGPSVRRNG